MYFYSILFGDIRYVYMAMMMLKSLESVPTEGHILLISQELMHVIKTLNFFGDPRFRIHVIPTLRDVYDGMRYKYLLPDLFDCTNKDFTYIDCDMLCVRDYTIVIPTDSFLVYNEGLIENTDYSGSDNFMTVSPGQKGLTAGFFMFNYGPHVATTFRRTLASMECEARFYTLDQPHFNKALYSEGTQIHFLPDEFVSDNMHSSLETCKFVNFCGDPGNGETHFRKMFDVFTTGFHTLVASL
jgi:hypothetical protein